ncbi:MAG: trehalose-6-phosphate synthase [Hyphomonas sp.]|nr:trehalose-6-phosphate synthase [Hyphomonas sp.]
MAGAKTIASAKPSERLVAVSNRTAAGSENKAGGLAVALWDTLVETKGLWVGWSGRVLDHESDRVHRSEEDSVRFALTDLSRKQYDGFYLGYANSVLWPVMHNRIDLAVFEGDGFSHYLTVNEKFARAVISEAEESDFVWVHDYHFMLMGQMMRQRGWKGRLGYFLHIPFPAPDAFRAIPQHKELGEGLCAFDVVGVQTGRDLYNLARYLEEEFGAEELPDGRYRVGGRDVRLLHCPIGIDAEAFAGVAGEDDAQLAAARLARFLGQRQLVVGVDRMDYSKGLLQRFEGMARLFDQHPDVHGRISFTQVAPPSRTVVEGYAQLREQLDELCGRINGDYGDLDWIPIRYLARGYAREEVAGLYRLAAVCLVTPLQDGMNLVAKEFVAAQDPEDPGVLVLSQFAGAAEQMKEALIVNPYDADAIAEAVYRAINMPLEERKERWTALMEGIREQDLGWWRDRFLAAVPDFAMAGADT